MKKKYYFLAAVLLLILPVQMAAGTEEVFHGLMIMDGYAEYLRVPVFTENHLEKHPLITDREDALALAQIYMRLQKERGLLDEKYEFTSIAFDQKRSLWIFGMSGQSGPTLTEYESTLVISAKNGALVGVCVDFTEFDQADEHHNVYIEQ